MVSSATPYGGAVHLGVAYTGHPEAPEIVPSAHCLLRFRQRRPVRAPGGDAVVAARCCRRWPTPT